MKHDVVIIGGGPAGLSLACSLAKTELSVAVIDKQSKKELQEPLYDGRDIALTHLSKKILEDINVWANIPDNEISPIRAAKVLDGSSPYTLDFDTQGDEISALGFLVSNHWIRKALFQQAEEISTLALYTDSTVTHVTTNQAGGIINLESKSPGKILLEAQLIVAADSRFSEVRRMLGIPASMHDFGRVCVVCRMQLENAHDQVAYECFHYDRTLAVLPLNNNQTSVVVTAPMHEREAIVDCSEEEFNHDIQSRFSCRYGQMSLVSKRYAYPLVGVHANKFYCQRAALIGDAAVGMHPVTAHGFNLGLSGQQILAKEIIKATQFGHDIADIKSLKRYSDEHQRFTRPMYHGTNEIVRLFTDDREPAKLIRKATLRLANHLPGIKNLIHNKLTDAKQSRELSALIKS